MTGIGQKRTLAKIISEKIATDTVFRLYVGFPDYVHMNTELHLANESNPRPIGLPRKCQENLKSSSNRATHLGLKRKIGHSSQKLFDWKSPVAAVAHTETVKKSQLLGFARHVFH